MSFVDTLGSVVWSQEQLLRHCERLVLSQYPKRKIRELDDIATGAAQGLYSPTTDEQAQIQAYGALRLAVREQRLAAEADNEKLRGALEYEQAVRSVANLELLINGREAVEEIPEDADPETGEIIQEFVAAIEGKEALPSVIVVDGEEVENPDYVAALADLASAQAIIASCAEDVLELVSIRLEASSS